MAQAVHQDTLCADLAHHHFDPPVDLLQIDARDFGAGHHHPQLVGRFVGSKVPAKIGRVAVILLGEFLEGQDHARLLADGDPVLDELHPQRGFAGARRAFDQVGGLRQKPAV